MSWQQKLVVKVEDGNRLRIIGSHVADLAAGTKVTLQVS